MLLASAQLLLKSDKVPHLMSLGRHELIGVDKGAASRPMLCGKLIESAHLNHAMRRFDLERDHNYISQRFSGHIECVRVLK